MLRLPFESKHIIGLTTDPDTWTEWFNARSMSDHTRQDRLFEAALSLDWLLYSGTPGITFVSNIEGEPEQAARAVIATVQAREQAGAMRKQVHEMLEKTAL
jgi:hypothetical protein